MVPLAENTALGIAIMSYNGQLNFGLVADYDALADLEALADELPPRSRSSRPRQAQAPDRRRRAARLDPAGARRA